MIYKNAKQIFEVDIEKHSFGSQIWKGPLEQPSDSYRTFEQKQPVTLFGVVNSEESFLPATLNRRRTL